MKKIIPPRTKEELLARHREYCRKYRERSDSWKALAEIAREKRKYGRTREEIFKIKGSNCCKCGITREEHRIKYGRDISVDHIDGMGQSAKVKNNHINNLQVLCLPCHTSKDDFMRPKRIKLSNEDILEMKDLSRKGKSLTEIKGVFNVHEDYVRRILAGKLRVKPITGKTKYRILKASLEGEK